MALETLFSVLLSLCRVMVRDVAPLYNSSPLAACSTSVYSVFVPPEIEIEVLKEISNSFSEVFLGYICQVRALETLVSKAGLFLFTTDSTFQVMVLASRLNCHSSLE